MGCAKMMKGLTRRLRSTTAVLQYEPYTEWIPCVGLDTVKLVLKRKSVQVDGQTTFHVKPAYQAADGRTDAPGNWTVLPNLGPYTGDGESNTGVVDVSSITAGKMYIRFGMAYYLGGTPTVGQADVELVPSFVQCGSVVGSLTQMLSVSVAASDGFVEVTGWIPALDAQKVVAAFVTTGLQNGFRCQLAYRIAETSVETPGAWTGLEAGAYRTTDGEMTTSELSPTVTTAMWVQFGLKYNQSAGNSGLAQATVSVTVAVRRT